MTKKTEILAVALVAVNLLIIAVVGYTAGWHERPRGVVLVSKGGAVKFDHELHVLHGSPGLGCVECHHLVDNGKGALVEPLSNECRDCHYYQLVSVPCDNAKKGAAAGAAADELCAPSCEHDEIHKRCVGSKCMSCHQQQECGFCHY